VEIVWHAGDRAELEPFIRLAEDSDEQLRSYLPLGRVLVARSDGAIVGHLQLIPAERGGEIEVKSLAVAEQRQGSGIGRALIERALAECRQAGATTVLVSTAAADVGALRFYQRVGFRMLSVERDAFTPGTGYPEPILIDGILLRDRVWLSADLASPTTA